MPLYEYKCTVCGIDLDRYLPLSDYKTTQFCNCGNKLTKMISAPAVHGDYAPYECPITGDIISGKKQHEENLARHGCRLLEKGEREEMFNRRNREDAKAIFTVASRFEYELNRLPTESREQVIDVMQSNDVLIERG